MKGVVAQQLAKARIIGRQMIAELKLSWQKWPYRWRVGLLFIVLVFLPRVTDLGTMLTIDEPLWRDRGSVFIKGFSTLHLSKTIPSYQPGVTTAWLVGLATPIKSLAADQLALALTSGVLVLIVTYFLIILWGWRWGLIGGAFVALDPFLLGHSRVVHTDALFALFSLGSVLALLASCLSAADRRHVKRRYVITSAVLGALAFLTKLYFVLLLPLMALLFIGMFWRMRHSFGVALKLILLWAAVFILTLYLVWPALWFHPIQIATFLIERSTLHAEGTYGGEAAVSQWWYYVREGFFRITPVTALLVPLALVGLARTRAPRMRLTSGLVVLTGLAFAVLMSFGADKGDRYILFSTLTLTLFGVYGLRTLVSYLQQRWRLTPVMATAIILLPLLFTGLEVIQLHPYYLAYYNRLYPIKAEHKLGWGEGLEQAAQWVAQNHPGAKVATFYPRVFQHFYDGTVNGTDHGDTSDIMVVYRSMFERGPDAPETEVIQHYLYGPQPPLHTITVNRLPYVWIFAGGTYHAD
jgi:hypothetical protein